MEDKKILKDKELDKVTGGTKEYFTLMKCSSCGYEEYYPETIEAGNLYVPVAIRKPLKALVVNINTSKI